MPNLKSSTNDLWDKVIIVLPSPAHSLRDAGWRGWWRENRLHQRRGLRGYHCRYDGTPMAVRDSRAHRIRQRQVTPTKIRLIQYQVATQVAILSYCNLTSGLRFATADSQRKRKTGYMNTLKPMVRISVYTWVIVVSVLSLTLPLWQRLEQDRFEIMQGHSGNTIAPGLYLPVRIKRYGREILSWVEG